MEEEKRYFTRSRLVAFLYELIRDQVDPRVVEKIISQDERTVREGATQWALTDADLSSKAQDFAERLAKDVDEGRTIKK